jgi:hypothetical protein
MVEKIEHKGQIIAILVSSSFTKPGIEFFTPNDFPQQLGYMNRKAGYTIEPHAHHIIERKVNQSQEVLFIKSGKVKVNLFDDDQNYVDSRIITAGDVIMLASGGHGFEILEDSEMIEVKQGPYLGDTEKKSFV